MTDTDDTTEYRRIPTLDDVHVVRTGSWLLDDSLSCFVCGDEFELDELTIDVPYEVHPQAIVTEHLHCAIRNKEVDLGRPVAGYTVARVPVVPTDG